MKPALRKSLTRLFTVVMVVMMLGFVGTMAQNYFNTMRCIVGMIDTCSQPSDTTIVDASIYLRAKPQEPGGTTVVMVNTNR